MGETKKVPTNKTGYRPGGGTGRQGSIMGNQTSRQAGGGARAVTTSATQRKRNDTPKPVERNPILWKKEMVDSGHGYKKAKWTRRASPKKAKPLDKSKKKGSPRSYENLKKSKPMAKGKNGKGPK